MSDAFTKALDDIVNLYLTQNEIPNDIKIEQFEIFQDLNINNCMTYYIWNVHENKTEF